MKLNRRLSIVNCQLAIDLGHMLAAIVLPLILLGCGRSKTAEAGGEAKVVMEPITVETAKAEMRSMDETVSAQGTISGKQSMANDQEQHGR